MPDSRSEVRRTVAVTGATGFVGRYVVRELLSRGHHVRALARNIEKANRTLPGSDASPVVVALGDVLDARALAELVAGADACIHLVGIDREGAGGKTFQRLHVDATAAVLDACREAGVQRYVHMSALAADPEAKAEYARTKYAGEMLVRRSGLEWTMVRPTIIHGPDGEFVGMMQDFASGEVAPWLFMPYFSRPEIDASVPMGPVTYRSPVVQPVWVGDVAWVFAEALARPETVGEIYNIVGPDRIDWPSMLEFFRDTLPRTNHDLKPFMVPGTHAAKIAQVARRLGLGSLLPFDEGQAHLGMMDWTADLAKARKDLRFEPRPFRSTVREYAARVE